MGNGGTLSKKIFQYYIVKKRRYGFFGLWEKYDYALCSPFNLPQYIMLGWRPVSGPYDRDDPRLLNELYELLD